jgi:uncharacterized membrane protein
LTTLFAANAQGGSRRKTSRMRMAEDFTGGKITRRISRATESMFQSVALMIFILIPMLTFAARNVAPQFATPHPSRGADFI